MIDSISSLSGSPVVGGRSCSRRWTLPAIRGAVVASLVAAGMSSPDDALADVPGAMSAISAGDCASAGREINAGLQAEDPQAYFLAGFLYDRTGCVARDPARATRLYRKASSLGSRDAQIYLGLLHGLGRGVPQDYARAHRAFSGTDAVDGVASPALPEDIMLGYVETVANLADRQMTYPTTANSLGSEATLDVVLEPATGRVSFAHVKIDIEVGRALARSRTFEEPLEDAYRAAIAAAPKPVIGADTSPAFSTTWRFRMRRDEHDRPLRIEGYTTVGPATALR